MKISLSKPGHGRPQRRTLMAFTMIEVMVAVTVILLAFVTVFGCMTLGISVTQLTRENLRATQIMVDKLEGLRLYSWDQLTNSTFLTPNFTNWFYETNNIGLVTAQGNGVQYTGTVQVVQVGFTNAYSPNMRQVNITVGWQSYSPGSVNHTRTMSTFVSQAGMQNYIFNN